MGAQEEPAPGPDLAAGVPLEDIPATGALAGHVGGKAVLLARLDDGFVAVSGSCTHYGAPLAQGLIADGEVRCPWHHACFSLRTGEAVGAPAFGNLRHYAVDVMGDMAFVSGGNEPARAPRAARRSDPEHVVIVGGGAAGYAAAERLRQLAFDGRITMLSEDTTAPCDRPNLSKDYLAGTAQEDWLPLRPPAYYAEQRIALQLGNAVQSIDPAAHALSLHSGARIAYDRLLLATGAEPQRLATPGFDRPNVFVLRSESDARAIVRASEGAQRVALIGSGFIGLEAAGALRTRGLDVHVVMREQVALHKVLGGDLGALLMRVHEQHGVVFHRGRQATAFDGRTLTLDDGSALEVDLVLVAVGVQPRVALAERAGLALDRGIVVDAQLRTSAPDVYAAGDVARYPLHEEPVRIEHWVHAQRQGQTAAGNMLGFAQAHRDVPFFWTGHHELTLRYVGHATSWDDVRVDGDVLGCDCTVRYYRDGKLHAAATVNRDLESLEIEAELRARA